ncbi:gastrula zinc finger protein XlCGF8.2DB-like [Procambarus clarkii]|uniref:gastrula zinc finger protein XlCGF8.2DB-like n=1 Tax=Procambarus clarkii TaxID=6728 RepID=UPI0037435BF4
MEKTFPQTAPIIKKMKTHQCPECGKVFTRLDNMKTHMLVHSECGKRFSQLGSMKTHMMMHSDERPFECDECGKRFRDRASIISHMLVHTEERPFECDKCGRLYKSRKGIKAHIFRSTFFSATEEMWQYFTATVLALVVPSLPPQLKA